MQKYNVCIYVEAYDDDSEDFEEVGGVSVLQHFDSREECEEYVGGLFKERWRIADGK